jgi:zinc transport system permease protein
MDGPEAMAVLAALIGVVAVIAGLFGSLEWDTPSGPSIVVAALGLFLLALLPVSALATRPQPEDGGARP